MKKFKDNKFKKKYPCVMQHDASDCAAAVVSTICLHYKKEVSIVKIRDIIGTDSYGTTVHGIVSGLERIGFTAKAIKINIDNINDNYTLPAISHVILDNGASHFVVINKIKENKIIISDPYKGVVKMDINEFKKIFSGVLILLIPNSEFELLDHSESNMFDMFKALILPQKRLLASIILVSFILTLIGILSSLFSKLLFDEIIPYQLKNNLYIYFFIFGIVNLIQIFLSVFRQYALLFLSRRIDIPVLLGYYSHILRLPYNFFSTRKVGDIITRFQDAMTIKEIFSHVSISLVMDIVLASITGIVLWNFNSQLFSIIILMVIFNLCLIYIFKHRYKILNYKQMDSSAVLNSQLIESIKNIETVKAFNNEDNQLESLEEKFINLLKLNFDEGNLSNIQGTISSAISTLGNLIFMGFGALFIIDGKMSIGDLIVFQTLSVYFVNPVQSLVSLQLTFQEAQIAIKRLNESMSIDKEQETENLIKGVDLKGDITFKNVTFRYGSRLPVLKNFNLTIPYGKNIAIVGESGSGKSTLAKLLLRFYDIENGKIELNGYDIKDIDIYYLRRSIGYVPQNIELFSGRLIDNITLGNKSATYEQVIAACKLSGCHDFIERLPARYHSYIEEGGGNFSGGERQRLAIARALLNYRDLYIFDESTSNLDSFSEMTIQSNLLDSKRKSTNIIIAHRLSTIVNCDLIIFMEKGNIIEIGTHNELINLDGKYKEMIDLQYGNIQSTKLSNFKSELNISDDQEEYSYG